jgi:hypothetical protein
MEMAITFKGLDLTEQHITKFNASMHEGMPETMAEIGEELGKYYSGQAFVSQGAVYGKPWAPLADSTVAEKSKNWPGRPPLVRTGDLQNGFKYEATLVSVHVSNKVQVSGKGGTYNLLELQQGGTSRGIPPRLVMALNDTLKTEIVKKIVAGITLKIVETRP